MRVNTEDALAWTLPVQTVMSTVIAAIDLGPSSARVLYHAAGFARLFTAQLQVLYVTAEPAAVAHQRVVDYCTSVGPYEVDPSETQILVRPGLVSDTIHREAQASNAMLVVMGSRGKGGMTRLLLGSTCEAVLRNTAVPVLLVPPIDLDIVSISDRAVLTCGPVLTAVDLAETNGDQLQLAAYLAGIAGQPLVLMTVAPARLDNHLADTMLRQCARELTSLKPHALIVRRGDVAEEISRCAISEGAGLVVMGLRARPRGTPGAIASAVLRTKRAFVLAVPKGEEV